MSLIICDKVLGHILVLSILKNTPSLGKPVELVLLDLPIMLWRGDFWSKSLKTFVTH